MELKDLVKYYVPMRMEGSSPPNWEVVFGYDISKFKGYNVDEVRVALNLTQLWLSQGPRGCCPLMNSSPPIVHSLDHLGVTLHVIPPPRKKGGVSALFNFFPGNNVSLMSRELDGIH